VFVLWITFFVEIILRSNEEPTHLKDYQTFFMEGTKAALMYLFIVLAITFVIGFLLKFIHSQGKIHPFNNWINRHGEIIVFPLILVVVVMVVGTGKWYASSREASQLTVKATQYIASSLNDPESAKFRDIRIVGYSTVCGEVNGKNLYGAYVGYKSFVYTLNNGFDHDYGFIIDSTPTETGDRNLDAMTRAIRTVTSEKCDK